MIKDLDVIKDSNLVRWTNEGQDYQFHLNCLDASMVDESRQLIFILSDCVSFPRKLDILNDVGKVIYSSLPPTGSTFYYLKKTESHEVVVVCSFEEKVDNWYDWHCSFDVECRELHRIAPAY